MRKTAKSELYKFFRKHKQIHGTNFYHVVDGGWLLHKFVWPHSTTYENVLKGYMQFITKRFGKNVTVIFDGYNDEIIGTKSYERYRRNNTSKASDVSISKNNLVAIKQANFLSNVANKYKLVQMLAEYLTEHGIPTKIAAEDADVLIVQTAIELINEKEQVAIVGNDVDLLVLSIGLTPNNMKLYFKKNNPGNKPYDVYYATQDHSDMTSYILFAHAFVGCDTTSAFFNEKKTILNIFKEEKNLNLVKPFYEAQQKIDTLYDAAEKLVMLLYKIDGESGSLNDLRYKTYKKSIRTSKKRFQLSALPPTKSALCEHVKRVYYQIQSWLGENLNPEHWGWKRTQFILIPVMMKDPPIPAELLSQVCEDQWVIFH